MLLWERLTATTRVDQTPDPNQQKTEIVPRRLPYDTRCCAITKVGRRCRGKIRKGTEFCAFHDPQLAAERRRRQTGKGGSRHHKLSHIPGGYLKKLTSRRAVGDAMDRLYREVRLGMVTPEMGAVLFNVLTRILDAGLYNTKGTAKRPSGRSKADKMRPKLKELLTQAERRAWRRAVANAPAAFVHNRKPATEGKASGEERKAAPGRKVALPAAS
ncbi:MAG: hypothetical protein JSU63_06135 [Phycisphaerales bacterium]|nr:MAG: hypothetical protein JSU63_06135 [Phycisphaerales bacterium]